jgi:peroxiredoxin
MTHFTGALRVGWLVLIGLALASQGASAIDLGDLAPNFALDDLDGTEHALNTYRPHPVLLMFLECDAAASTSLAPLVESEIYEVYAGQELMVLGLDSRNCSLQELENFRNQTGVEFPILRGAASTLSAYGIPDDSFVLVDGGGFVRYLSLGPGTASYNATELRTAIDKLLRDANQTKTSTWGLIKSLYN